jgi:hypothetical protein
MKAQVVARSASGSRDVTKYIAMTKDGRFFMFENEARNGEMFHENAFEPGESVAVTQEANRYFISLPTASFTVNAEPFEFFAATITPESKWETDSAFVAKHS